MVVEDDAKTVMGIKRSLKDMGYAVTSIAGAGIGTRFIDMNRNEKSVLKKLITEIARQAEINSGDGLT